MKNKKLVLALGAVLSMSLAFTGCAKKEDKPANNAKNATEASQTNEKKNEAANKEAAEVNADMTLAGWEGDWNNMGAYLEDPEVQDAYKTLAEEEKTTPEEAKKAYVEKRKCDFDGMVIEGNKVTFLDGFKDKDGKEISSAEYEYAETMHSKLGDHDLTWEVFKAKGDAKYPVLMMMGVHGDEGLVHFHFRYGDDANELIKDEKWFPTMVKPSSTMDQIAEEIAE